MKNYWKTFRQLNRSVLLYMVYWFLVAFAYFGVEGVLINLYLLRLGYGPEFIGLLLGFGQLAWALLALPAGTLGARIGAKRATIAGLVLTGAGAGLLLCAEALPLELQPAGLVITWMASWAGASLFTVNSAPYLMAVTDAKTRGFAFSVQQTVMAVAGFAGSLLAGVLPGILAGPLGRTLADPAPYRLALVVAPAAYMVGALLFARAEEGVEASPGAEIAPAHSAPIGLFIFLGLVIGLQGFSEGSVRSFFNVYLDTDLQMLPNQIGGIMGAAQLLMIPISLFVPAALGRWGSGGTLLFATFGLSLATLLLAGVPNAAVASVAFMGFSGLIMTIATARGIYSQEAVVPRWRTTVSAVTTVGLALGAGLAAWLGGRLAETIGYSGMFILGAAAALVSAGMLIVRFRRGIDRGQVMAFEDQARKEVAKTA